jgi:hypothetical protein
MYLLCNVELGIISQTVFMTTDEQQAPIPIATAEMAWLPHVLISLCEEHEIETIKLTGIQNYLTPIIEEITTLNKNIKIEVIESCNV